MKIAVYSGSFDPLHIGHGAIMRYLTQEGGFDSIYLVVSPQNPLKDPSKADSAKARYLAACKAVRRHPELNVKVDDIELKMLPPTYTIRTLDTLKKREPLNDFTLVIGADNLDNFHEWKDAERILTEYGVVVFPRRGYDYEALRDSLMLENKGYRITLVDAPLVDISSTAIREGVAAGKDMKQYLL